MKKISCFLIVFILAFSLCGCGGGNGKEPESFFDDFPTGVDVETVEVETNPEATVTLGNGEQIVIELYYHTAPNAVQDFIALAKEGIYNSMSFNEVRNHCIVMTGVANGEYDPPYYVKDEISNSDSANGLSHTAGVVSMIKTSNADTLTGQFFILTKDQTHFDNQFTAFGRVKSGMDIVEKIASSELNDDDTIVSPYIIQSVVVETFGVKFPNPTIIMK